MLNELHTLERSLRRFNVGVEESHPWVKRLGRASILIAEVGPSGLVTGVEYLDWKEAVTLFKIQKSNHSNFPAVNWPSPVWELDQESPRVRQWLTSPAEDAMQRLAFLREICETAAASPKQHRELSSVRDFCRELAQRFRVETDEEYAAFPVLMQRLLDLKGPPDAWIRSLSNAVLGSAAGGSIEMLRTVEELLAGTFNKKMNRLEEAKVPILFDLADCTQFHCRVASPRMGSYFSRRLNATEAAGERSGTCALTGERVPLEVTKMPSPRLPVLGDTVLMSMNPDTPCQTRYGRIGTAIFPVGKRTVSELDAALKHLTAADRQGKNWKPIPKTTGKKFNLLLVYLESSPELEAPIAELFAGPGESDVLYSSICSQVCEALRGRETRDSDLFHLFVLNKIDPGRVQVELSDTFTAEEVIRGGAEWERGAKNRPSIPLRGDDFVPSPSDVMRCLRMKWERGGASYSEAPGCDISDVYDVLVGARPTAEASALALLRLTLQRTSELLYGVGHAAHRSSKEAWKSISRESGRNPLIAVSLLGIVLDKLGKRKESYVRKPAFMAGRLLSLADTLHAEYSKAVRNALPPQLLGNSLIPTAISDPNKGLARMLQRIRVYQAWAQKDGTGLARWSCGEMGKIAVELAEKLPQGRLTEPEQAQLLLGYLARSESSQDKQSEEGVNE